MSDAHQRDMVKLLTSPRYSDLIITVGPEKTRFDVHQNILCTQSPFFDRACSEHSKTTPPSTQIIDLPAVNVKLMKSTLHYLYTGELDVQISLARLKDMVEMSRLWSFLEMFSAQQVLIHGFHTTLSYNSDYITEGDKSELVSMIHDLYTYCGNEISSGCRGGLKGIVELLIYAMEKEIKQKDSILKAFDKASGLHPKLWLDIVQALADRVVVRKTRTPTKENTESQQNVESEKDSKDDSDSGDEDNSNLDEEDGSTCESESEMLDEATLVSSPEL